MNNNSKLNPIFKLNKIYIDIAGDTFYIVNISYNEIKTQYVYTIFSDFLNRNLIYTETELILLTNKKYNENI